MFSLIYIPVDSQVLFGFSGGFSKNNFRTRDYNYSIRYKTKNSYNISAFIKTKKTKHFWLGFESFYKPIDIDLITSYNALGGSVYTDLSCNLGYLYSCLNSEFRFGENYSFYFSFNPFLGIKVFGQGNGTSKTYTISHNNTIEKIENSGDLFKNESGLIFKIGYDMLIGNYFRVLAEVGYSMGLAPIYLNHSNMIKSSGSLARLGIIYQLEKAINLDNNKDVYNPKKRLFYNK